MKISICVPQYNRINYLLKSLKIIEEQTYNNIEIVISDDGSTDETESEIKKLIPIYKYPILFSKNPINKGYDYNYRKCIELATGSYAIVIGNDDSIHTPEAVQYLVDFLAQNNLPDVGFCNCVEERTNYTLVKRAHITGIMGTGTQIALKYYSTFSFVGGLIYKKSTFDKFNTDKYDGSIYSQMYLGCYMVASGCTLFSIEKPLVIKDLLVDNIFRNSYRDRIAKNWSDYKTVNGGLPSVINVLISSFRDAQVLTQDIIYKIHRRIYSVTYLFWIQDYKSNDALPEAVGLIQGMFPSKYENFNLLSITNKIKIFLIYFIGSVISLMTPNFVFQKMQNKLYQRLKK